MPRISAEGSGNGEWKPTRNVVTKLQNTTSSRIKKKIEQIKIYNSNIFEHVKNSNFEFFDNFWQILSFLFFLQIPLSWLPIFHRGKQNYGTFFFAKSRTDFRRRNFKLTPRVLKRPISDRLLANPCFLNLVFWVKKPN